MKQIFKVTATINVAHLPEDRSIRLPWEIDLPSDGKFTVFLPEDTDTDEVGILYDNVPPATAMALCRHFRRDGWYADLYVRFEK